MPTIRIFVTSFSETQVERGQLVDVVAGINASCGPDTFLSITDYSAHRGTQLKELLRACNIYIGLFPDQWEASLAAIERARNVAVDSYEGDYLSNELETATMFSRSMKGRPALLVYRKQPDYPFWKGEPAGLPD